MNRDISDDAAQEAGLNTPLLNCNAWGYPHSRGDVLDRAPNDVLIKSDLRKFLTARYQTNLITEYGGRSIIHQLEYLPASDLYDSNKANMQLVANGLSSVKTIPKKTYISSSSYEALVAIAVASSARWRSKALGTYSWWHSVHQRLTTGGVWVKSSIMKMPPYLMPTPSWYSLSRDIPFV